MQTMNPDSNYYPNIQANSSYYAAQTAHPQFSNRNSNSYGSYQRMSGPMHPAQIVDPYQPQIYYAYPPQNGQRGMVPSFPQPPVIRPSNEINNGTQNFSHQSNYSPYSSTQPFYLAQNTNYPMQTVYPSSGPMANQSTISYSSSQQTPQSVPTSQTPSLDPTHGTPTSNTQEPQRRAKKPLIIVDPNSKKAIDLPTSASASNASSTNPTDSTNTAPTSDSASQKIAQFRQQFAQALKSDAQTDKNPTEKPTEESSTKENPTGDVQPILTSSSRSGSISKQLQSTTTSDIPTESPTEDKPAEDQNQVEAESTDPMESFEEISPSELLENIPSVISAESDNESATLGETPSTSKRIGYTIEELRRKRLSLLSQERPNQLKEIAGVTTPAVPKHMKKPEVDGDKQYIRDVTAILNKLTPSNNEKLVKQLDQLEMNNAERINGLISVMFTKAVEAAIFCPIYAELCKHFKTKQVTVPDANGQAKTYIFRQLLLTRCQGEFEGDYRQEIDYERRQAEVETIADEKAHREAAEQLEEDLGKAKRKKLGNITFIGELFKLDMLIDTIMYDCVEYLLRDKTDEESLECLCRLLPVIGAKLDAKANEKLQNRKKLEKNYEDLANIVAQRQTSSRIRFLIQDVLEMRKAGWIARRAEVKPQTIDKIHEDARVKREQEDFDREREKQQRREQNRYGGPQPYGESRGSRGSGSRGSNIRQQSTRTDEERNDSRVIVDSLRQYQSNEKRNQGPGPLSFAPQRAWGKGSGVEKKPEDDRSNAPRTGGKPPTGNNNPPNRSKGNAGYPNQRQSSRELARENSLRERESVTDSLRRITSTGGSSNPNNASSRESSRNVSREQSRNVSPDSSVNERALTSTRTSTAEATVETTFDENKTKIRVQSLIQEYTENYSDNSDRPVTEAIEDLSSFCTSNVNQQAFILETLISEVLDAKPRARKAVGHLLDAALSKNVISSEGFLSGVKLIIEVVPDYVADIPLIWQYIGQIFGAFIGAPSSNMNLFKPILQTIPQNKVKQVFQDILRYAVEFSSQNQIQKFWQSAGLSLNDLLPTDPSLVTEYAWLTESVQPETPSTPKEIVTPRANAQLVKLFKSIKDQDPKVTNEQIVEYIQQNMDPKEKYYIRNIVLSYLEACLINRESQKKIQEDIAKQRTNVLIEVIAQQPENELQAIYAIQNFVHKLEHPPKMAQLLFDIFHDQDCVSEETFLRWFDQPDASEMEGHSVVRMSTNDFFDWLKEPDSDNEDEKADEN